MTDQQMAYLCELVRKEMESNYYKLLRWAFALAVMWAGAAAWYIWEAAQWVSRAEYRMEAHSAKLQELDHDVRQSIAMMKLLLERLQQ